ncbi:MAG: Fic family protein [Rhodocyclaceae bacterium]|nr:Fic family protein [Rhodocyclaceae bacterium]
MTYTELAERLAVNIARCLDALLENDPGDIDISSGWIRALHQQIAGDLFPEWAGRFRTVEVQVGTHFPPAPHTVALHVENFCRDLAERIKHVESAESIAKLLAWADWRFQWIHPFKDFNGRVGRILLVALCYKLNLPPVSPAVDEAGRTKYFAALRQADRGDFAALEELWIERLGA